MIPRGLSLLQAPPFSVIARFYITSPLFGLLGALLGASFLTGEPFNLPALVHLFTIGFMASVMIGSLFQMLPVVVGAVIEDPLWKSEVTHVALTVGLPLLVAGFLSGQPLALGGGMLLIAGGVYFITAIMLYRLFRLKSHTPTARGMKYAVSLFALGILFGVLMILSLTGIANIDYAFLLRAHLHLLLFGWIALLIVSVAFQVIEMFFVTPPYPRAFADRFPAVLTLLIALTLFTDNLLVRLTLSLLLVSFALLTISRLRNRRRKIPDPLVNLWYTGMVLLAAAMALYPFTDLRYELFLLFLFLFGSFAHSVILAMIYRIIPFLVWFHMSSEGVPSAPTMHEVIRPKWIWLSYRLHLISVALFLISFFSGSTLLWSVTAGTYLLSFSLLFFNVLKGVLTYFRRPYPSGVSPQH